MWCGFGPVRGSGGSTDLPPVILSMVHPDGRQLTFRVECAEGPMHRDCLREVVAGDSAKTAEAWGGGKGYKFTWLCFREGVTLHCPHCNQDIGRKVVV